MPASRLRFALADAVKEMVALCPAAVEGAAGPQIEMRLDLDTYTHVVGELEYHFGASLQKAHAPRDLKQMGAPSVKFAGMTIIGVPIGRS